MARDAAGGVGGAESRLAPRRGSRSGISLQQYLSATLNRTIVHLLAAYGESVMLCTIALCVLIGAHEAPLICRPDTGAIAVAPIGTEQKNIETEEHLMWKRRTGASLPMLPTAGELGKERIDPRWQRRLDSITRRAADHE